MRLETDSEAANFSRLFLRTWHDLNLSSHDPIAVTLHGNKRFEVLSDPEVFHLDAAFVARRAASILALALDLDVNGGHCERRTTQCACNGTVHDAYAW